MGGMTSGRVALLAGAAVLLGGLGWLMWQPAAPVVPAPAPAPAADAVALAPPEAATADVATAEPAQPEPAPPEAAAPEVAPPEAATADVAALEVAPAAPAVSPGFDTVRVTPDGAALVAGRAAPGAEVAALVDGALVATGKADATGSFALLFDLPGAEVPRLLTLEATLADGRKLAATDQVALAPTRATAAMAAEPAAAELASPDPVASPEPAAALLLTEQGAQVLAPAGAAGELRLDAISYTATGAVQLAGVGQAGASVQIYLDNALRAATQVGSDAAWALVMPDVAPGRYTLRVDQMDATGKVTARFETPFQRETLAALAAAAPPPAAPPADLPADLPAATPAPVATAVQVASEEPAASPQPDATAPPVQTPMPTAALAPALPPSPPAPPAPEPALAPAAALSITVQPGFSLWRIARDNLGQGVMYVQVYEANRDRIRDPDLIYPGQVFIVPAPHN